MSRLFSCGKFWALALEPEEKEGHLEAPPGPDCIFHLSSVCLEQPGEGKQILYVKQNDQAHPICVLEKDKMEFASLGLEFSSEFPTSFYVKGNSRMHLTGNLDFEDESDDEDDDAMKEAMMGLGMGAGEEDEEEESEEDDDEEEEGGEGEEEEEEEDEEDEDEEDEEDDESEKEEEENQPADDGLLRRKILSEPSKIKEILGEDTGPSGPGGVKRKAPSPENGPQAPPTKQAKNAAASPAEAGKPQASPKGGPAKNKDDVTFETQLVEYLKKHSKVPLAELGQKIKKPAGVQKKLGNFLKERPEIFKIDGAIASLVKK
mmetsp:Transcript_14785/g.29857  ORF Transcript_14785/g.29857 Transcript_14785/m.29857 type:complete len:318 (-) Transcript_14785:476-1429(-)